MVYVLKEMSQLNFLTADDTDDTDALRAGIINAPAARSASSVSSAVEKLAA